PYGGAPLSEYFPSRPKGSGPEIHSLGADARERLRENPVFERAQTASMNALLEGAELLTLDPKALLARSGDASDHVDFLIDGHLRVFHHESRGREVTVKHLRAPSSNGDIRMINGTRHGENAEALVPSRVVRVRSDRFWAFLERERHAALTLVHDVARRCCMAKRHQASQLFNVDARIASLLLGYLEACGKAVDGGIQIRHPLTQAVIAGELGVNIRSVNRTIQSWKESELLSLRKGWVIVHRPSRLAEIAGSLRITLRDRTDRRT
ncbi:MAG: Crp/Fnr family transcriptional regulator, partial [Myxococcota bacterium]